MKGKMRKPYMIIPAFVFCLTLPESGNTHPTGNLVIFGDYLLWSYVFPVDDPEHHACVMIWDKKSEPRPYIVSEYPASDWMIYSYGNNLYLIERRYIAEKDEFQFRVLKASISGECREIWPWTSDQWRIGEGGFFMDSDDSMIFCSYPGVYRLEKGLRPVEFFRMEKPVKKLRQVSEDRLLLISEEHCHLTTPTGKILETWDNLLIPAPEDPPLGRNMIFDADYQQGDLLIAYWGNRSFMLLPENSNRIILYKLDPPWTPHWVAYDGNDIYLFASSIEAGRNPQPKLLKYNDQQNGDLTEVWVVD